MTVSFKYVRDDGSVTRIDERQCWDESPRAIELTEPINTAMERLVQCDILRLEMFVFMTANDIWVGKSLNGEMSGPVSKLAVALAEFQKALANWREGLKAADAKKVGD